MNHVVVRGHYRSLCIDCASICWTDAMDAIKFSQWSEQTNGIIFASISPLISVVCWAHGLLSDSFTESTVKRSSAAIIYLRIANVSSLVACCAHIFAVPILSEFTTQAKSRSTLRTAQPHHVSSFICWHIINYKSRIMSAPFIVSLLFVSKIISWILIYIRVDLGAQFLLEETDWLIGNKLRDAIGSL